MAKLTIEDKKEIIRLRFEKGFGARELSRLFNVEVGNIKELIRKFEVHGEAIFDKTYRTFEPSVKLEVINRY